jgi:hypothetical protein
LWQAGGPDRKGEAKELLSGSTREIDPDWWKSMTDEEIDDFLEGCY